MALYTCANCEKKASRTQMYHDGAKSAWLCPNCTFGRMKDRDQIVVPKPDLNVKCAVCGKGATRFRCEDHVNTTDAEVDDDGNIEMDGVRFVFSS